MLLKSAMNNSAKRKIGVLLTYVQIILSVSLSIFSTPIITASLGQEEFGIYSLVLSFASYINLFQLGIGSSYIRYYSVYRKNNDIKRIENMNGTYLLIFSLLGAIALFFSIIMALNMQLVFPTEVAVEQVQLAQRCLFVLAITTVISFPAGVFISYIIAHEEFVFYKIVNIVYSLVRIGSILAVLSIGKKSVAIFVVTMICTVVLNIAYIGFCIKKLKFRCSLCYLDKKFIKSVFVFSFFIALNSIVDQLNWNIDKKKKKKISGTVLTAIYAIGSQLNTMYMEISTSLSDVFTPMIHKVAQEIDYNKKFTQIMIKVGRIQFLVLGVVISGFFVCGKQFINIWLGNDYELAYYVSLVLMIPVTIPLIQNVGIEMLRARNKHKYRSIIYSIMAVGNMILSIPLCKVFGIVGAASGTSIMLIVANGIIMNLYYKNSLGIDIKLFWKNICKLLPAPMSLGFLGCLITKVINIESMIELLIFILSFSLVYLTVVWCFSMNSYEKSLVRSVVSKFLSFVGKKSNE